MHISFSLTRLCVKLTGDELTAISGCRSWSGITSGGIKAAVAQGFLTVSKLYDFSGWQETVVRLSLHSAIQVEPWLREMVVCPVVVVMISSVLVAILLMAATMPVMAREGDLGLPCSTSMIRFARRSDGIAGEHRTSCRSTRVKETMTLCIN